LDQIKRSFLILSYIHLIWTTLSHHNHSHSYSFAKHSTQMKLFFGKRASICINTK
jgi:hypothetical protein